MQIHSWMNRKRGARRGFTSAFCLVLLCALTYSVALTAEQPQVQSPSTQFGPTVMGKPAEDITVTGTVQQLVKNHVSGTPVGVQLLVAGSQGVVTANLGTELSRSVQQSLSQGAPIRLTGAFQTINGKEYLLVRTLTIAGQQITIRNEYGFLTHYSTRSRASANSAALYRSSK